jgi:hypothetical protein
MQSRVPASKGRAIATKPQLLFETQVALRA